MFISCDFGGLDVDDRRLPVSFRVALAECGEIMTAHNQFGRARHLADLQPVLHPPDIFFAEGRAPRRDLIKVAPRNGVVAGMKTIGGLLELGMASLSFPVFTGKVVNVPGPGTIESYGVIGGAI